jgi:hypothetical protein
MIIEQSDIPSMKGKRKRDDGFKDPEFSKYLKELDQRIDGVSNIPATASLPNTIGEQRALARAKRNVNLVETNYDEVISNEQTGAELALKNTLSTIETTKEYFSILVSPSATFDNKKEAQEQLEILGYPVTNSKDAKVIRKALTSGDSKSVITGTGKIPGNVKVRFTLESQDLIKDVLTSHTSQMACFARDIHYTYTQKFKQFPITLYESLLNITNNGKITKVRLLSSGDTKPKFTKKLIIDPSELTTFARTKTSQLLNSDLVYPATDTFYLMIGGKPVTAGITRNLTTKETNLFTATGFIVGTSENSKTMGNVLATYKNGDIKTKANEYPMLNAIGNTVGISPNSSWQLFPTQIAVLNTILDETKYYTRNTTYNFTEIKNAEYSEKKDKYIFIDIKPSLTDYEHIELDKLTTFDFREYEIEIPTFVFLRLVKEGGKIVPDTTLLNTPFSRCIDFSGLKLRGIPGLDSKEPRHIVAAIKSYLFSRTVTQLNKYIRATDRARILFMSLSLGAPTSMNSIQKLMKILEKISKSSRKIPDRYLSGLLESLSVLGGELLNTNFTNILDGVLFCKTNLDVLISGFKRILDTGSTYTVSESRMLMGMNKFMTQVLARTMQVDVENSATKLIRAMLSDGFDTFAKSLKKNRSLNLGGTTTAVIASKAAQYEEIVVGGMKSIQNQIRVSENKSRDLMAELRDVQALFDRSADLNIQAEIKGRINQVNRSMVKESERTDLLEKNLIVADSVAQTYSLDNVQMLLDLDSYSFAELADLLEFGVEKAVVDAEANDILNPKPEPAARASNAPQAEDIEINEVPMDDIDRNETETQLSSAEILTSAKAKASNKAKSKGKVDTGYRKSNRIQGNLDKLAKDKNSVQDSINDILARTKNKNKNK